MRARAQVRAALNKSNITIAMHVRMSDADMLGRMSGKDDWGAYLMAHSPMALIGSGRRRLQASEAHKSPAPSAQEEATPVAGFGNGGGGDSVVGVGGHATDG